MLQQSFLGSAPLGAIPWLGWRSGEESIISSLVLPKVRRRNSWGELGLGWEAIFGAQRVPSN